MWLIAKRGFYSIVEKPEDRGEGLVTVRARVRQDIETLVDQLEAGGFARPEIIPTPRADYKFRVRVPKAELAAILAGMVMDIDYDNFKNTQPQRAHIYGRVWSDLFELERGV